MILPFRKKKDAGDPGDDVLNDPDLWHELKAIWLEEMEPFAREIFDAGIEYARSLNPRRAGKKTLEPDQDALDAAAEAVFRTYMNDWWRGLQETTRDGLRAALTQAAIDGSGTPGVIEAITPLFGEQRAKVIGVTETTRLFGQGAVATYQASGMGGWIWLTSEDDLVCEDCAFLDGTVHSFDEEFEPEHPNCRCFPLPLAAADDQEEAS